MHPTRKRTWVAKFRDAFRGVREGVSEQHSFAAHFTIAALVLTAAGLLRIDSLTEWAILILCITVVLTAEMFNSSLESLALAITDETHPHIRDALDIGSAAVLLAAIGSAVIGILILGNRLAMLLQCW